MSINAKPQSYNFHPLELAFVGHSGVGKTTLMEGVVARLKERWKLAYVKHDAHRFQMDAEGKDTFRAAEAGALGVYISSAEKFAFLSAEEDSLFTRKSRFLDFDAVLVEGYKSLSIDKICFLDASGDLPEGLAEEAKSGIKAYVGSSASSGFSPYFCRDDVDALSDFIESIWLEKLQKRPLKALILAGGMSQRMGQDKGLIKYSGRTQVERLSEQLHALGIDSYLSLRAEQKWELPNSKIIHDRFLGFGPFSGLLTAMEEDRNAAWLVIACDLPLLTSETLENLLKARDPRKMATAYRSANDGLPEPLCAIYEPKIRMRLYEAMGLGLSCPRKVLLNSDSLILEPLDSLALENANTPDDFLKLKNLLDERSAHVTSY